MTGQRHRGMLNPVMMHPLVGFAIGIAVTIPLIYIASRRTERRVRQLEAQRRANERLAEQGRLTGGLAHEIKNPLSTVGLNLQLVDEDLRDLLSTIEANSDLHERLGRVERRFGSLGREIQRLRDILEDFLRFAGRIRLDRARTDVAAMINEMVDFFAPQAEAAGVRLRTQHTDQAIEADLDASLLKQALLNLLINAVQAMSDGRGGNKPHGGCNELIIRIDQRRDMLNIHVTDTGPGIDTEHVDKLFEPYYSTKKGGTGLGLPTSRRIVEEHGGTLTCHSEPGRGTNFTIALPLQAPTLEA
jgi:signal transduction histidine kinase